MAGPPGDPAAAQSLIDSFRNMGNEFVRPGAVSGLAAARSRCGRPRLDAFTDQAAPDRAIPGGMAAIIRPCGVPGSGYGLCVDAGHLVACAGGNEGGFGGLAPA